MARIAAYAALAVVLCAAVASANDGCTDVITGYSATYGKRATNKLTRFQNQTSQWRVKGAVTKANVYYSTSAKCVQGIKMTYGYVSTNALLLGMEKGLSSRDVTLAADEFFNKVQAKGGNCIEYIRLITNKGRNLVIGNSASTAELQTSTPTKSTGFLAAIRGYEEYTKFTNGSTARGPMDTLQIVWANCAATTAAVPLPSPKASPSPSPVAAPKASPSPSPVAAPKASPSPSPAPVVSGPTEPVLPNCPAALDSCAMTAAISSPAYCSVVSPFIKRTCVGGCCASSGKCSSSSCTVSGLGKEVANVICYGVNAATTIGASPTCLGLGCWLTVPGCTSNLLGGSCVGTVVAMSGDLNTTNPAGLALVGKPCLDVTVSDTTLAADGSESQYGHFVSKLWSVCACNDTGVATSTGASELFSLPAIGKLNVTSIATLLSAVKGVDAAHPLQSVVDVLQGEIPRLVVPQLPAVNLTRAITFLGSLVGTGEPASGGAATPLAAVLNFAKGASALAHAGNSTNPLGSVLGAMTKASASNATTNPLAGLANLVSALAPAGADTTEKSDILSSILGALSGSSSAASPAATLLGVVSNILDAAGNDSPLADAVHLLSKFAVAPSNKTGVVAKVKGAVAEAKAAATRVVNLLDVFKKVQSFLGGGGSSGGSTSTSGTTASGAGTSSGGGLDLASLLNAVKAITGTGSTTPAATTASNNPLAFLTKLIGGGSSSTTGTSSGASSSPTASGTGSMSLQSLLDVAAKVAPVLQSLSGASSSASGSSNPLSSLLGMIGGSGGGGLGIDLSTLGDIASKVSPLLQALGGNSGAPAAASPTTTAATKSGALGALTNVLSALGVGGGGSGLSLSDVSDVMDLASKAAPVLKALQGATSGGGSLVSSIQSFLNTLGSA